MSYTYKPINQQINFSQTEVEILKYWEKNDTFHRSLQQESKSDFTFYDGPPFANGLPHYGHLLSGYIKDVFARYKTMCGYHVQRRFGWDCHGLPAELAAEKELGISGQIAIDNFGINKFNAYCRESVLKYTQEWNWYVNRQARWVDFDNDYKTMDLPYMESVLWVFKSLYEKGLIYRSSRVMPYSWACETPVSDFETKIDNSYREKQSKTATIAVKLVDGSKIMDGDLYMLIWTTTPWTLPSNLALAVGESLEYSVIKCDERYYIIASALAQKYEKEIGAEVVYKVLGQELLNLHYEPIFDYFKSHPGAFKVISGDFVTTEDGTGIVHIAPGFGEDDQRVCADNGIEIVCPVDSRGCFTESVSDYYGLQVFETNDLIIQSLKKSGVLIKTDTYLHNYPFCWRTDTPLIYKAVPSWYLRVTAIKDQMIKNNKQINWIPGHIKSGLFGKWLENARDWSISRNRFWGCPIPIWESTDPNYPHVEVYGSITEIEEAFGVKVDDLHMPFINTLTKPNPSDPTGKSMLQRVPEVLDCWFESGSMPYGQAHYPFENKQWFNANFPADFIVEYVAQTRGWFYTLLVLSTALFNKPPFLNCICHGVILGDGGQKMSKRLQNYPDPKQIFEQYGSDALRCFMLSSPVMRGQDLIIDNSGTGIQEAVRRVIKPLWNAYNFFILYANIDSFKATFSLESTNLLDAYIISSCLILSKRVKLAMDNYDTITAIEEIEKFLITLNNWYIRRSRERFWKSEMDLNKASAFNTLYSILLLLCKLCAPLIPLISEEIYINLTRAADGESVHLEAFPEFDIEINQSLVDNMEKVREASSAALNIRNKAGVRVRQPLRSVTFIGLGVTNLSEEMQQLVLDEINVKAWVNLDKHLIPEYGNFKLQLHLPIIGKRIPQSVKEIIPQAKSGNWKLLDGELYVGDIKLEKDEYTMKLEPKESSQQNCAAIDSNDGLVIVDLEIDHQLKLEGIARDIIRFIQQTRKELGFEVTDKIHTTLFTSDAIVLEAIDLWRGSISLQTLSNEIFCSAKVKSDVAQLEFEVEIESNMIAIVGLIIA
jgi:isoleucyl-tRNA synthetase